MNDEVISAEEGNAGTNHRPGAPTTAETSVDGGLTTTSLYVTSPERLRNTPAILMRLNNKPVH